MTFLVPSVIDQQARNRDGLTRTYSRSFVSYEIPFRPDEEIPFAETEGLDAYCIAYRDDSGRVMCFVKILLVRDRISEAPRISPGEPAETYYLDAADHRIEYADTESLDDLLVEEVGPDGQNRRRVRYRRDPFFVNWYTYWPNGEMRSRISRGLSDGASSFKEWHFDQSGKPVTLPLGSPDQHPLLVAPLAHES